jgi:SAM-dependent methyltransferase
LPWSARAGAVAGDTVRMNRVETALMNNPLRRAVQRYVEVPLLRRMGGVMAGGKALEVGCGQGFGTELIVRHFGAGHVDGVDIDPAMLDLASRRVTDHDLPATVLQASADDLPFDDGTYDAVFDFGILHHVVAWRVAVSEVARVLRPGGRFYFEEVTAHALARPSYRRFLDHPTEDRFSGDELVTELEKQRLVVGARHRDLVFGDFVVGVAERGPRTGSTWTDAIEAEMEAKPK